MMNIWPYLKFFLPPPRLCRASYGSGVLMRLQDLQSVAHALTFLHPPCRASERDHFEILKHTTTIDCRLIDVG